MLMQGTVDVAEVGCFCSHCRAVARERGIDVNRAMQGYRELVDWNQRVGAGGRLAHSLGARRGGWSLL